MKSKKKALVAASVLAAALLTALLVFPSSGAQNAKLVLASSASAAQWPNTNISTVRLRSPTQQIAIFYATGETAYLVVGENISEVRVAVNISTTYAGSSAEAMANTKVNVTITHPTQGTIYSGWLDVVEASPWTGFYNVIFSKTFSQHTLVAGTYTITTIYQVYA